MKLLVVEDDQGILAGLEYSLTEEGYEAALCGTKAEALEALMKERFDLCLLDLGLPGRQRLRYMPGSEKAFGYSGHILNGL